MEPVEPINHALVAVTSQGATRGPSAANAGLIFILLQRVAHAFWRWRRMRRYGELSRGAERSSPRQFFPDCTIAMCGYDLVLAPEKYNSICSPAVLEWRVK